MRIIKYIVIIPLIVLMLLTSCAPGRDAKVGVDVTMVENTANKETSMPEEMPKDFELVFSYGVFQAKAHNGIDTINNKIYKDLVMDGLGTVDYEISKENLKMIYKILREADILSYPNPFKPKYSDQAELGSQRMVLPNLEYHLSFVCDGVDHEMYWNDTNDSEAKLAVKLRDALKQISNLFESTEEYQGLPPTVGGYD